MSEYLVGSPAFKAGGTGDPRTAGSIPVHLRQFALGVSIAIVALLVTSSEAFGSARLLSSTPQDGAVLEALDQIAFDFDALLIEDGALVTVTRLDGTAFGVTETIVDRTTLRATGPTELPLGNYEVGYEVRSSDGTLNEGSVRITIEDPSQAFSGGLLVVLAIAVSMAGFVGLVFRSDKRRRPGRG